MCQNWKQDLRKSESHNFLWSIIELEVSFRKAPTESILRLMRILLYILISGIALVLQLFLVRYRLTIDLLQIKNSRCQTKIILYSPQILQLQRIIFLRRSKTMEWSKMPTSKLFSISIVTLWYLKSTRGSVVRWDDIRLLFQQKKTWTLPGLGSRLHRVAT